MRLQAFFHLLGLNLYRNARHLTMSSLGIILGVGSFLFFVSLGYGVKQIVSQDLLGILPVNQIEIVPKSFDFGMFRFNSSNLLGNGKLTEQAIERLRALPEVDNIFGKMNMRAPAFAMIPIPKEFQKKGLNSNFYTEIVVQGIDPQAIPEKELQGASFHYQKGKPVPILISNRLLELYNATLADMRGFPKLTAKAASLISFKLNTGRSIFRKKNHPKGRRIFPSRVIGVSSKAILLGATAPLSFVRHVNSIYGDENQSPTYQSAIIEAKSASDMPSLLKKIEGMGFTLESSQIFAQKIGESIMFITLLLTFISIVIMFISAVSISHAFFMFVYERRYQIGLMRAVGATRSTIRGLILMEATVTGCLSGLIGMGFTYLAIVALRVILPYWQNLPFSPQKLFFFPVWLPFLAMLFAPIFCVIGAFIPAQRAASMDPSQVLNESK